jgi:hypothetical protein
MARTASFTAKEIAEAQRLRDEAATSTELRKALSVLLVAQAGLDSRKTSEVLGISERTVFRDRSSVGNQDAGGRKAWGGRRHYCLTIEEETEFLREWEGVASQGGVLVVPPIHAALVKRLGHAVPMSTTYRLLARHGWRKVQPDTKHPKSDQGAQEEFKKKPLRWWQPPV